MCGRGSCRRRMTVTTLILIALGLLGFVALAVWAWPAIKEGSREGLAEARANIAAERAAAAAAAEATLAPFRADLAALPEDVRFGILLGAPLREMLMHGPITPLDWAEPGQPGDDPFWLESFALPEDRHEEARKALERDWGITDATTLRERAAWLLTEGHREEIARVVSLATDLAGLPEDERRRRLDSVGKELREAVGAALEVRARAPRAKTGHGPQAPSRRDRAEAAGDAFDICRATMLAANGLALGLLERDAATELLQACREGALKRFFGWEEYGDALVMGAEVWVGLAGLRFAGMQRGWWRKVVDWLLADPRSPWTRVPWPAEPRDAA